MHYILDACALLAFLNDEEGAGKIEDLLERSASDVSISISIVNLLEVYYGELHDKGSNIAQIVLDVVQHYSIKVVNTISEYAFQEAARLKATYKMSLADCIGLATAIELSGEFVTSDHHELDVVAKNEPIPIFWFR
ncbi:MAG: PIN domain-containing protein [Treponema sp.]|nr:PIN domain-containing protein [Treponema sp.]